MSRIGIGRRIIVKKPHKQLLPSNWKVVEIELKRYKPFLKYAYAYVQQCHSVPECQDMIYKKECLMGHIVLEERYCQIPIHHHIGKF